MKSLLRAFKIADRFLANSMKTIIIVVTVMAIGTMFLQVLTRYVFNISISGLDEITGHTAVWMYLIGAAYGTYDRSQIKADMLHLIFKSDKILNFVKILTSLVSIIVACYMTVWSYGYVVWSITKHETTPALQIPTVYFQISFLISGILMVIYFTVELVDNIRFYKTQRALN